MIEMKNLLLPTFVIMLLVLSCKHEYIPKPKGYFRIEFPEKSYSRIQQNIPYSFEIADYSSLKIDSAQNTNWADILTPANKADLHLTYIKLNNDLAAHTEESRELAYDHSVKADAIEEQLYINNIDKVFGTVYYIEGNAASPLQFYLTDSTKNFLRGALYIREIPNIDSISPVIDFLTVDVVHLIETTKWND